jgi:hypothetical protein
MSLLFGWLSELQPVDPAPFLLSLLFLIAVVLPFISPILEMRSSSFFACTS